VVKQMAMETKKPLHEMFTEVPPRYDLINHLITWEMDRGWRKKAALTCLQTRPARILDLCCGTGDLALTMAALADYSPRIDGLDYSQPMLAIAAAKAAGAKKSAAQAIKYSSGEAAHLPYPGAEFDCIGISFAFRNLTYKNSLAEAHLAEIVRVLKAGGRFVIVESSQPANRLIRALNHFYMRAYTVNIGAWISGNRPAYRYLAESACRYFSPPEMKAFLIQHGFRSVEYRPLFFGAAGIYTAIK
jgi:demethylmenaquinone methyltransferase / 2-methoxy-6-polyprenyl-1,4-benzoquinol methylase